MWVREFQGLTGKGRELSLSPQGRSSKRALVAQRRPGGVRGGCSVASRGGVGDFSAQDAVFSNCETAIAGAGNRGGVKRNSCGIEGGLNASGCSYYVASGTSKSVTALAAATEN